MYTFRYVEVYSEHLGQPATVPAGQKAHKLKMEQVLGFGELCVLWEVAMATVRRDMKAGQRAGRGSHSAGSLLGAAGMPQSHLQRVRAQIGKRGPFLSLRIL